MKLKFVTSWTKWLYFFQIPFPPVEKKLLKETIANSMMDTGENVELDRVKRSFQLSDLEKLPQELIYQVTGYLNLTDFLQFIQVSKRLSKIFYCKTYNVLDGNASLTGYKEAKKICTII
ncbi:hypothetical protein BC833DRAFT_570333 [Globomyces pollinis-pini]|nr:hypothetical protein BC833DRAFT_570333 [Globomyces pollinis-pini]